MRRPRQLTAIVALTLLTGCVGTIRETTTERTSTEQLLLSTAAERAIARFGNVARLLKGKRVVVDDSRFEGVDKSYVISSLRHFVSANGGLLLAPPKDHCATCKKHGHAKDHCAKGKDHKDAKDAKPPKKPERIVEIRNGALGIKDTSWGVGIPPLPLPVPQTNLITTTPPAYLFYRGKQEGWAKFQIWIYDPIRHRYLARSGDLWGHSYYSTWWILFVGPFDASNDIYPDADAIAPLPKPVKKPKKKPAAAGRRRAGAGQKAAG